MGSMSFDIGDMQYNNQPPQKERGNFNPDKDRMKKICLIVLMAVVIAGAIFGIVKIFSGGYRNYKKVAESFVKQMVDGTMEKEALQEQYPRFMEETIEEVYHISRENAEYVEEKTGEDLCDIIAVTVEIVDKEKIEKDRLKKYQNDIIDFVDDDDEEIKVQGGYKFTVKMKAEVTEEGQTALTEMLKEEAEEMGYDQEMTEEEMEAAGEEMKEEMEEEMEIEVIVLKCNKKTGVWKTDGEYIWEM